MTMRGIAALACIGCLAFAYLWADRSVSLSYMSQSASAAEQTIRHLETFVEDAWVGVSEEELLRKLHTLADRAGQEPRPIIKREQGAVWFDDVRFNLDNGRVSSVGARRSEREPSR